MVNIDDLKEKIIQKFKTIVKTILKVIAIKLMPIILIGVSILVCIAAFIYFITVDDGTYKEGDWSNTGYVVSEKALSKATLDNIEQTNEGYGINIDLDTTVDDIIQTLEDENGVLDQYISDENVKEYLKAFIRAELITQYPDLRSADKIGTPVEDNELFQGCIQIHRSLSEGDTELLTYIDYDTFSSYISEGNENATNHFSLDPDGNLVVAGWTRVTTNVTSNVPGVENIKDEISYTLTTNSIDYKSMLKQYTMPFDFLWALTVTGEDEDFAYNVAQLALDSKIIISVQDNLTTVVTNTYEEYDLQEKIEKSATITAVVDDISYSKTVEIKDEKEPVNYYTETNIKNETCTTNVDVTYADTWISEYTNIYSNVIPSESVNEDIATIDDTEYELIDSGTLDSDSDISSALYDYKVEKCEGLDNYLIKDLKNEVSGSIGTIDYEKYERTFNNKITTTVTTSYNTYNKGTPSITEKTDRNSSEDNFVTLFIKSDDAYKNILSVPDWLFETLEGSPTASDMVDTVKYLLYKATDKNYGVTSLDLSIYNTNNFNSISTSGMNLLKEYIRYWEHSSPPPTNADGTKYIIETDGAGHPTVGYGVDIENSGYKQLFVEAGYPTNIGGEVDIEFVDAIEDKIIASSLTQIKSMTADLDLTGYQINALVSRAYNCGISGAISVTRGSSSLNFISSYNTYWNSDTDDRFEEQNNNADFSHSLYTQYMSKPVTSDGNYMAGLERRRKSEWVLFQTGYYNVLDKWHSSANSLLEAADIVHQQEIQWTYSTGNDLYWNNIEMSLNNPNKVTCCAAYVSCAIYYAGYFTEEQMNNFSNYNYCPSLYVDLKNAGWQVISSYNELEPGDVVFTNNIVDGDNYDHVQIYAGDNTWYSAGKTEAIQGSSPYSQGDWARQNFYVALRPN